MPKRPKLTLIQGGGQPLSNEERWQRFSDRLEHLHAHMMRLKKQDEWRKVQKSWRPAKKTWRP